MATSLKPNPLTFALFKTRGRKIRKPRPKRPGAPTKGPSAVQRLVKLCSKTTHIFVPDHENFRAGHIPRPGCNHCNGTGTAGHLLQGAERVGLACACLSQKKSSRDMRFWLAHNARIA